MLTTGYHQYTNNWRARGVLCLLWLALVVRSVIPIGYMPDTSALRDGRIVITFCTAQGTVPATFASLFGDNNPHPTDILSGNDCPFCSLSHEALNLPVLSALRALPVAIFSVRAFTFNNTALPVLGARGPPLGSRAPPFFFS